MAQTEEWTETVSPSYTTKQLIEKYKATGKYYRIAVYPESNHKLAPTKAKVVAYLKEN